MTTIRRAVKMPRRGRGDDGVSILLALVFLSLFGVLIGVVLTQINTGMRTTSVVSDKSKKVFAADGGIDFGIQAVRSSQTSPPMCRNAAAGVMDVGDIAINGRTVHVTCQTLAGEAGATGGIGGGGPFGPSGYTMVATGFGTPQWGSEKANPPCRSIKPDVGVTSRQVIDVVTTKDSTTVTSATGNFTAADVGTTLTEIVGQDVLDDGATVVSVTNPTTIVVSIKAKKTAAGSTIFLNTYGAITGVGFKVIMCPNSDPSQEVFVGGNKMFNAAGFDLPTGTNNVVIEGSIEQLNTPPDNYCTRDKALQATNGGNPQVGGAWTCLAAGTAIPWPQYPDLKVVVPTAAARASAVGTCTTTTTDAKGKTKTTNTTIRYLYPGKYTAEPDADMFTYLMSGVYYFENTGETVIGGGDKQIWGGEPNPGGDGFLADTLRNAFPAGCESKFTDAAANTACGSCFGANYNYGKGVTFVMGGATVFDIHAASTELFSRKPGAMDAGATPRTTIFAWPASPAAPAGMITGTYVPHAPGLTQDRCNCSFVTDKSGQQITFHGMTYSPFAPVDVFNNSDQPVFEGGVVASEIVARVDASSANGQFAGVIGASGLQPTMRTVLITAVAPPSKEGQVSVVSSAIVTIDVNANRTTVVKSWRNQGPQL